MDAKAQAKALFRSRIRETSQKREKRIDNPLVRYNEDDQPVCRVCNIILKSESLWSGHQASRKHHEAIENVKAAAAARQSALGNSRLSKQQNLQDPQVETPLSDCFDSLDAKKQKLEQEKNIMGSDPRYSSLSKDVDQIKYAGNVVQYSERISQNVVMKAKEVLPGSFFDNERDENQNHRHQSKESKDRNNLEIKQGRGYLPSDFFDKFDSSGDSQSKELRQQSEDIDAVQLQQVKGALPAGFFDNKDADLRARGIEPVKVHIEDAYKEFEKEIQVDLQEVDDRLEEEEIDAGEAREEIESHEQKAYRERVEMLKQQLIEAKKLRLAKLQSVSKFGDADSSDDSSDDGAVDEDFSVDWRAKRL